MFILTNAAAAGTWLDRGTDKDSVSRQTFTIRPNGCLDGSSQAMITCSSQAMAEPLLLVLLPIAIVRMRGAASEKAHCEDATTYAYAPAHGGTH